MSPTTPPVSSVMPVGPNIPVPDAAKACVTLTPLPLPAVRDTTCAGEPSPQLMAYSKPPYAALACPMVLLPLWRRRLVPAVALGLVGVVVVGGAFGVHALVSGEANYQGGDRKTFYGGVGFPFEAGRTFDTSGDARATDENNTNEGIFPRQFWPRLGLNVEYFLVGRHFGLVPYGFPAIVALGAFVWSAARPSIASAKTWSSKRGS